MSKKSIIFLGVGVVSVGILYGLSRVRRRPSVDGKNDGEEIELTREMTEEALVDEEMTEEALVDEEMTGEMSILVNPDEEILEEALVDEDPESEIVGERLHPDEVLTEAIMWARVMMHMSGKVLANFLRSNAWLLDIASEVICFNGLLKNLEIPLVDYRPPSVQALTWKQIFLSVTSFRGTHIFGLNGRKRLGGLELQHGEFGASVISLTECAESNYRIINPRSVKEGFWVIDLLCSDCPWCDNTDSGHKVFSLDAWHCETLLLENSPSEWHYESSNTVFDDRDAWKVNASGGFVNCYSYEMKKCEERDELMSDSWYDSGVMTPATKANSHGIGFNIKLERPNSVYYGKTRFFVSPREKEVVSIRIENHLHPPQQLMAMDDAEASDVPLHYPRD